MQKSKVKIKEKITILAIESSCDETAAAVIGVKRNGSRIKSGMTGLKPVILSNVVSSQADLHAKTGGVVPEVASRAHMEAILPVVVEALLNARRSFDSSVSLPQNSKSKCQMSNKMPKIQVSQNTNWDFKPLDFDLAFDIRALTFLRDEITHIAVTAGPGLIGSLLVGFNAAKSIAYALDKPIIPVNHIEGHIYSALAEKIRNPKSEIRNKSEKLKSLENLNFENLDIVSNFDIKNFEFPVLALVVSGGHTSLILMKDYGQYEIIGETLDDAAGEAFDKVAKLLDLGYPGGPVISKLAGQFRDENQNAKIKSQKYGSGSIIFPRPLINDGTFNFSFSGLKTAVLYEVRRRELGVGRKLAKDQTPNAKHLTPNDKSEIAAAFEDAVVDVLVTKMMRAIEKYKPKTVVLSGGVAANSRLRQELEIRISKSEIQNKLMVPPLELCGDNAAMIGLAAYHHLAKCAGDSPRSHRQQSPGDVSSWDRIKVDSNWELGAQERISN